MDALLVAIVVWLSSNFNLPATSDLPRVQFTSASKMSSLLYTGIAEQEQAEIVSSQSQSDVISLYSNQSKTIYLLDGWSGRKSSAPSTGWASPV